jgi:glycosyltransferase involved in cell wall biosynthesis/O-antigen/teichoic acid export membrane protein
MTPSTMDRLIGSVSASRLVLLSTGSMVSSWIVNSLLGFGFWWVASRQFSQDAVGLASATVAASILIGRLTVSGLGTSLAGFMPSYRGRRSSLLASGVLIAAAIGATLGLMFAVIAPIIWAEYGPLRTDLLFFVLFVTGVGLTSIGVVLDQILLSLHLGNLQLLRNIVFAGSKLLFLVIGASILGGTEPTLIFGVWALGDAVSLLLLLAIRRSARDVGPVTFAFGVVFRLARDAIGHHAISSARTGPALFMPVLVTGMLSASANAAFYVALILTTALQVVASSATFTLYAVGARSPHALRHQLRVTLGLSSAIVLVGMVLVILLGPWFLGLFGPSYVEQASASLPWLAACAIPLMVIDHWIALRRIRGVVRGTVTLLAISAVGQILAAAAGAMVQDITGLAIGWFLALAVTGLLVLREVVTAATSDDPERDLRRFVPAPDAMEPGAAEVPGVTTAVTPAMTTATPRVPTPTRIHITVFIPIHNDGRWLPGAIESVLAQTHADWDLVVGDNASTDDIAAIVAAYPDPRIRYHRFDEKASILESWNRTAALCTGDWIQPLAADDRIRPDCLAQMAGAIEDATSTGQRIVLAISSCRRVYPDGSSADRVWYGSKPKLPVRDGLYAPNEWLELCTADGQPPWNVGSVVARRSVVEASGGLLRPEIGLSADFEAAMRIGAYGHTVYLTEPLLDYTVRDDADGPARLRFNRAQGVGDTVVGLAFQNALHVHDEVHGITAADRRRIMDAVSRSHLQRAGQHRVLQQGKGRGGAVRDVVRAIRWSPRLALRPANIVYAVAAIVAPRVLLEWAKDRLTDRHHATRTVVPDVDATSVAGEPPLVPLPSDDG